MGVEPGADRGAALRELIEPVQRLLDALHAVVDLRRIAAEFLSESQRGRVLQVRAADLEDVLERLCLVLERLVQPAQARDSAGKRSQGRGDMHRGGEGVV